MSDNIIALLAWLAFIAIVVTGATMHEYIKNSCVESYAQSTKTTKEIKLLCK